MIRLAWSGAVTETLRKLKKLFLSKNCCLRELEEEEKLRKSNLCGHASILQTLKFLHNPEHKNEKFH